VSAHHCVLLVAVVLSMQLRQRLAAASNAAPTGPQTATAAAAAAAASFQQHTLHPAAANAAHIMRSNVTATPAMAHNAAASDGNSSSSSRYHFKPLPGISDELASMRFAAAGQSDASSTMHAGMSGSAPVGASGLSPQLQLELQLLQQQLNALKQG
jgi:hypothetical protein